MAKQKFFLIQCCLLLALSIYGQAPAKRPTVAELREDKWNYLQKTVQLTATEQRAVKPLFEAYENNKWSLHRRMRNNCANNVASLTDEECRQRNEELLKCKELELNYFKIYHAGLSKALRPRRLCAYYAAERSYKHQLLHAAEAREGVKCNK